METDIGRLDGALAALVGADAFTLGDPEVVMALQRDLGVLTYIVTQSVAAFDAAGEWALDGAQNASSWLSTRCHVPLSEARAQLRRGRALPSVPLVAQAFASGEIGVAQVDVLVKAQAAIAKVDQEAFGRDE
jgi:uncharacterized protein DUF222